MVKLHKVKTLRSIAHHNRGLHPVGTKHRDISLRLRSMRLPDYCFSRPGSYLDSFLQFVLQGVLGGDDKENGI
jgi:hypothetical protein